jgi:hypothetical protein
LAEEFFVGDAGSGLGGHTEGQGKQGGMVKHGGIPSLVRVARTNGVRGDFFPSELSETAVNLRELRSRGRSFSCCKARSYHAEVQQRSRSSNVPFGTITVLENGSAADMIFSRRRSS